MVSPSLDLKIKFLAIYCYLMTKFLQIVDTCPWSKVELIWIFSISVAFHVFYSLPSFSSSITSIIFHSTYVGVNLTLSILATAAFITPVVVYYKRYSPFFDDVPTKSADISSYEDKLIQYGEMINCIEERIAKSEDKMNTCLEKVENIHIEVDILSKSSSEMNNINHSLNKDADRDSNDFTSIRDPSFSDRLAHLETLLDDLYTLLRNSDKSFNHEITLIKKQMNQIKTVEDNEKTPTPSNEMTSVLQKNASTSTTSESIIVEEDFV